VLQKISAQFFMGPAQRRLFLRGLPVFTYHSVGDAPAGARDPFLYVSKARFDEQLRTLRKQGFTSGTFEDLTAGDGNPERKVVITFDDGYRNVLRNGLEVLLRQQFRAIQYIVAGMIGTRNEWDVKHGNVPEALMDTGEIREWLSAGQEIGSHSLTHANLPRISEREAREQIMGSKKKLEDTFGIAIKHFAYPGGQWSPGVRDLVCEAGYATACTTAFGVNTAQTPRFELKRIFALSKFEMIGKVKHRIARKLGAG
jgi:peptidoglycan/xylan/chitin deacetylase (PgdA/CDA1 family)